jgi:hypothetical protein
MALTMPPNFRLRWLRWLRWLRNSTKSGASTHCMDKSCFRLQDCHLFQASVKTDLKDSHKAAQQQIWLTHNKKLILHRRKAESAVNHYKLAMPFQYYQDCISFCHLSHIQIQSHKAHCQGKIQTMQLPTTITTVYILVTVVQPATPP